MRDYLQKNEVAKLFKTTRETLRHYEAVGLLHPNVSEKGYREYSNSDLNRLRILFFLRDMKVKLEDMDSLLNKEIAVSDHLSMINKHYEALKLELMSITKTIEKVESIKELLENREKYYSTIRIKHFKERYLYEFNYDEGEMMFSPKKFYDKFKSIIEMDIYREDQFCMLYPYSLLDKDSGHTSIACIEVNQNSLNGKQTTILPEGDYISIFYVFKSENQALIDSLKQSIDTYLSENNLSLKIDCVFEIEHHEFDIVCKENETVYELQIPVKKEKKT